MKILILGYSDLARRKIIPAIKKIKSIRIDIASKSSKKENIGQENWYRDYNKALKESDAEIVYISLVNSLHFNFALKAIFLGKHVIVDKPITLNLDEAMVLLKLAKRRKVLLAEALTFNYHKQFSIMQNLIKKNSKIQNIIMKFNIPKPKNNNFKLSKRMGGGCFNDMTSYAAEINRIFLKKNIKIKSANLINENNLNTNFSINSFNGKIEFYGNFSHDSEYENSITFSANNYYIKLERFCAPPSDTNLILTIKKRNKLTSINIPRDDMFENFLREYIFNLRKKDIEFYHKRIIFNYKFKKKLKEASKL
jgi:NDP-hexose-3-ketoreductase